VYAPLPCYNQSADKFDEIIEEISGIVNNFRCIKKQNLKFFIKLPLKNTGKSGSVHDSHKVYPD